MKQTEQSNYALSPAKASSRDSFARQPRVSLAVLASPWATLCRLLRRLVHRFFDTAPIQRQLQIVSLSGALLMIVLFSVDVYARVGGGQSYGGGGGHGGGGGGGAGALVYLLVRFLIWLTVEYTATGIPVDIIVIALVIYWFAKPSKKSLSITSTSID